MLEAHKRETALVLFFILTGLIFWSNVPGLYAGLFDETGLPSEVIPLHAAANGFEGTGWFLAAWLTWRARWRAAAWTAYFLAGMWCWDMITTAYLPAMPVPPHQWAWGPLTMLVMVLAANRLWRRPFMAF